MRGAIPLDFIISAGMFIIALVILYALLISKVYSHVDYLKKMKKEIELKEKIDYLISERFVKEKYIFDKDKLNCKGIEIPLTLSYLNGSLILICNIQNLSLEKISELKTSYGLLNSNIVKLVIYG